MKKLFLACVLLCAFFNMRYMFATVPSALFFPFILEDHKNQDPQVSTLMKTVEQVRQTALGWCSQDKAKAIATLILNVQPKICVEIGTFGGSSILPIALSLKFLNSGTVYAIDSWDNQDSICFMPEKDLNKSWWSTVDLNRAYDSFIHSLHQHELQQICIILKEESVLATARFNNESIDFLHWDGNHSFLGAERELKAYLPKVKKGGYILVSDVMWAVIDSSPIHEAVEILFAKCELIDTIENGNVFLFQKL